MSKKGVRPTPQAPFGVPDPSVPPRTRRKLRCHGGAPEPMVSPPTKPLQGCVAIVTGTRGLGRGIALRLARDSARCVVTYRRNAELATHVVEEVEREGVRGLALPLELTEPSQVGPVFERIAEASGRVDILVANATATAFRPLSEQKPHNVRLTFAISVDSLIWVDHSLSALQAGGERRLGQQQLGRETAPGNHARARPPGDGGHVAHRQH